MGILKEERVDPDGRWRFCWKGVGISAQSTGVWILAERCVFLVREYVDSFGNVWGF